MGRRVIRLAYDVGPGVGLGHRARMRALAAGLARLGHDPILCECLLADSANRHSHTKRDEVLVVDSYRLRADRDVSAATVVAVDDLERDLAVDLVVDPAPLAGAAPPVGGAPKRVLRGPEYALVDPDLAGRAAGPEPGGPDVMLVTTGAADAAGHGAAVASEVRAVLPGVTVRLAVGPWSSGEVPAGVEPVHADGGLAGELARASVVVSASGVTLLEALALGRPVVAFVTAGNQRRYFDGLAAARAIAPATPATAASEVARLVADPVERNRLAERGRAMVDGLGALRVARAVAELS